MLIVKKNHIAVRKLKEEDAPLLVKWLSDPKVLMYYEGRDNAHDLEMVREHFYPQEEEEEETRCIVEYKGTAIGYIQFYPITEEERSKYGYINEDCQIYGMDQFIGEPAYWNRGIGTLLVQSMRDYIASLGVKKIVMDPQVSNQRALRCYQKCGFIKKKVLPTHEWHEGEKRDCWLIEYRAE